MALFRKRIGLALGSGGPRGLSHIGVIKVLEENNIPIDYVAGSSIGALVGGFYSARKNVFELEKLTHDMNWLRIVSLFFDPSFKQGLASGDKLTKFIKDYVGLTTFNQLKIPFCALATDFQSGKLVELRDGLLFEAIRTSCAMPLLFKPVISKAGRLLSDGGLAAPVPVETVKKMGADVIIAVNLNADYHLQDELGTIGLSDIAKNSITILSHHLAEQNIKAANLVICPQVGNVHWQTLLKEKQRMSIISLGEEAMKNNLNKLKDLIGNEGRKFSFISFCKDQLARLFR